MRKLYLVKVEKKKTGEQATIFAKADTESSVKAKILKALNLTKEDTKLVSCEEWKEYGKRVVKGSENFNVLVVSQQGKSSGKVGEVAGEKSVYAKLDKEYNFGTGDFVVMVVNVSEVKVVKELTEDERKYLALGKRLNKMGVNIKKAKAAYDVFVEELRDFWRTECIMDSPDTDIYGLTACLLYYTENGRFKYGIGWKYSYQRNAYDTSLDGYIILEGISEEFGSMVPYNAGDWFEDSDKEAINDFEENGVSEEDYNNGFAELLDAAILSFEEMMEDLLEQLEDEE